MNLLDTLVLRLRHADNAFFRAIKAFLRWYLRVHFRPPRFLLPVYRGFWFTGWLVRLMFRRLWQAFYVAPVFYARAASVGRRLTIEQVPGLYGVELHVGDDVYISGRLSIDGGRIFERPRVILGDRVFLGDPTRMLVAREITIEEGAGLAGGCFIADFDGHPLDLERRLRGEQPLPEEVQPVRICRNAWIGRGCYILKGVTIGEGALVAAGSVVINDIPAHSVAIGNPARVVRRMTPPGPAGS